MGVEHLGEAISELKVLLRGGADVAASMQHVCDKHDVVEGAVRRWFEENTERSPEEYREVTRHIVTLEGAIAAAARRWVKNPYGPNLVGRRFHVDTDDRAEPGRQVRRWYRYIGDKGHAIDAIDEETLQVKSFDGHPDFRRDIRREVKDAVPYDLADRVQFWGDDEDLAARQIMVNAIRLVLWDTSQPDELNERIKRAPTLTHLYQSLTPQQRAELRDSINNPSVRVSIEENGKRIDPLLERNLAMLQSLERGEDVPSPIHQQ